MNNAAPDTAAPEVEIAALLAKRAVPTTRITADSRRVLPGDDSKYPLRVNFTLSQHDEPAFAFPLKYLQAGWPGQLLFTYRERWVNLH